MRTLRVFFFFNLAFVTMAAAQVASHAPTNFKATPNNGAVKSVPTTEAGKPIVRVNGTVLTDIDLTREEFAIFPYAKQHGGVPKDLEPQIRDGAMKMIVFEELVYQEALKRKMTISPAKMAKAEKDFRAQFKTPEEFNALMQQEFKGSHELFLAKIRRSLLIDALLKIEVGSKSAVTPAELKAYYEQNATRYDHPELYRFQSISFIPPETATTEQVAECKKRAEKTLPDAKTKKTAEEFGLLAEKNSDDDYRVMMGQHKPMPSSEIPPEALKVLAGMKDGEVSGLIQMGNAYMIIRLNEHIPAGRDKFETVKAGLLKELEAKKTNDIRAAFGKKLHEGAKIEML